MKARERKASVCRKCFKKDLEGIAMGRIRNCGIIITGRNTPKEYREWWDETRRRSRSKKRRITKKNVNEVVEQLSFQGRETGIRNKSKLKAIARKK